MTERQTREYIRHAILYARASGRRIWIDPLLLRAAGLSAHRDH